jgi:ABC-2 type transport system ATP-binding protein
MSVIAMVLAARAYDIADYQTRAEDLLRQCQLSDRRDTLAQALSRGARQKVAICAAHIHNAKAILFDEPLTGLDPHAIRTMKASIRERAAAGAGFIVSSHLLSLIDDLCTHLLVLHQGQALFTGTVDDARALASQSAKTATLEESFFHIVRDAIDS